MTPSVNRPHRPKVHSKVILTTHPSPRPLHHLDSLEPFLRPLTITRLITPRIPNNEALTKTITTSMERRGKVRKVSKMVRPRSNVRSVDTTYLSRRVLLNFLKVLLSKLHPAMLLLERVRTVVTPLPTHQLNPNNPALVKHPSLVHKTPGITHMATLTTPVHTTLRM